MVSLVEVAALEAAHRAMAAMEVSVQVVPELAAQAAAALGASVVVAVVPRQGRLRMAELVESEGVAELGIRLLA